MALAFAASAAEGDAEVSAWLEKWYKGIKELKPNLGCRDLFGFALNAAAAKWHPERIDEVLDLATQMQDREPKNRTYGNFKWYWKDKGPDDLNAAEFCMQQGILIWMFHKDGLSAAGREKLDELIRFGMEGVKRRGVKPGYTNIFLMHVQNLILIGENTERPDVAKEGYAALDEWLNYTWKNGIHEYVTTTYYGTDLDCLNLTAKFTKNEQAKAKVQTALRYLWTDIAANWFAPCERLGGAHSRDYDYLTGHGMLDVHLRPLGLVSGSAKDNNVFRTYAYLAPPAELLTQFAKELPRTICQRWGDKAWETSVHYMGKKMAVGSAGACYCPEDKSFTINFAGGPKMVVMNFVMDGRGDPYGVNKAVTGGGHMKSHHLTPFLTSVQRGADVLLIASDNTAKKKSGNIDVEFDKMLAHLVLPAELKVWFGEELATKPAEGKETLVPTGKPIFLQFEDVAVGLRPVMATDCSGKEAPLHWINDGVKQNATRLTWVLSEKAPEGRGTVAFFVRAAEGITDESFGAFRKSFGEVPVHAKPGADILELSAGTMQLVVNPTKSERKVRDGGEAAASSPECLLNVNGKEVGREILKSVIPSVK
jgi:hypothetical protein